MTTTRDPDRQIRAWLDLMPDEAPDRAIAAVLQATEAAPQLRSPFGLGRWRFLPMNRTSLAALAVAIIVVVAGGAFALTRSNTPVVGGPSAFPTVGRPTPVPSISAGKTLPSSIIGTWFGPHHDVAGLGTGVGTMLKILPGSVAIVQSNDVQRTLLSAAASIVGGRLQVSGSNCTGEDAGSYAFAISNSRQTLTISDGQDDCATRLAALSGTWDLVDCTAGPDASPSDPPECLGLMDAGTYGSQYFIPMLAPGTTDWTPRYGGVTFTVPDGWANWADWPQTFGLTTSADYGGYDGANDPRARIRLFANAMFESQATPCSNDPAAGVATTPAAIADAIRGISNLKVSQRAPITIDGHAGLSMDITVATAPARKCDGTDPVVEFLIAQPWNRAPSVTNVDTDGMVVGEKQRLMLLDNGAGGVTAIYVHAGTGPVGGGVDDSFDTFSAAAMPIVQTLHFQ
jgi:hypothetical protein